MIKICHQISTKVQNDRKLTVALFFSKPLYTSRGESHFYGTEYEIWADFWSVDNTKKNWVPILINF